MSLSTSNYNEIMRMYDDRRRNNAILLDERIAYVNEHIDGYKELSEAISSLTVEHTARAIAGDKAALAELSELIADLRNQKAALLKSASIPEDYLSPIYTCPDCKDTGYINGAKCHCLKQQLISQLYEQSNIKDSLENADFSMLSEEFYSGDDLIHFRDSLQISRDFVKNFDSDYQNLLFYGTVGTGKSLISSCITKEILATGHSAIYFSASSLFDSLARDSFDNKNHDKIFSKDIYECDLLIIDDLGTEMTNTFTVSALFALLNERALRRKSVVISTNLSLEDLKERYSDRIFSRITGGFTFCRLSGPDIRLAHKFK